MRGLAIAALAAGMMFCARAQAADTASRACLTSDTRSVLEAAERAFARRFQLVSTCRPGAIIAGTKGHPSEHAFGRAVDLLVPRKLKRKVVRFFFAHARGVTMTYRNMPHVHFDMGHYHKLALGADAYGGRGRHWPRRVRNARLQN